MRRRHFLSTLSAPALLAAADDYPLGPDSQRQPGVPKGTVTQRHWTSTIFPGTVRDYWVYVPAQYDAAKPACLMVIQDGGGWVKEDGAIRATIVFDNLIHWHEMPVTIGVFIDPGVLPAPPGEAQSRYNRSFEYDALGDRYARFLIEEILPEVAKGYRLSSDPNDRAIGGASSGGICAFTVAWNRPDAFRRVLSWIGSYTDLRGGDIYPNLIRKTEPKPLRVYLQDGKNDLSIYAGSWYLANQTLAAALEYAGYEVTFTVGTEGHNSKHGAAVLPDALRWLWRDYPKPVAKSKGGGGERQFSTEILDPDSEWQVASEGHQLTAGLAVDHEGAVFFSDAPKQRIHRIGVDGKVSVFRKDTGGATGLAFGADGRLYACQSGRRRVVAYSADGRESVLADPVDCRDLTVTARGEVYFTDPAARRVWLIDNRGQRHPVVEKGLEFPAGVRLSADHALLLVADYRDRFVWSYQIQPDGSLINGEPFYRLETPDDLAFAGSEGMAVDSDGYLYDATRAGVQVCDQPGRVVAILNKPQPNPLSSVAFGGPELDWLFVANGDRVYKRHLRRKGTVSWIPRKPPLPRL